MQYQVLFHLKRFFFVCDNFLCIDSLLRSTTLFRRCFLFCVCVCRKKRRKKSSTPSQQRYLFSQATWLFGLYAGTASVLFVGTQLVALQLDSQGAVSLDFLTLASVHLFLVVCLDRNGGSWTSASIIVVKEHILRTAGKKVASENRRRFMLKMLTRSAETTSQARRKRRRTRLLHPKCRQSHCLWENQENSKTCERPPKTLY